jgi:hypothetical protein
MIPYQIYILNLIQERLENISVLNGYHFEIEKIKRESINNFTGKQLPVIYYWSENDTRVDNKTAQELRQLPIIIAGFYKARDNNLLEESINFGFDIYTALHRNPIAPKVIDSPEIDLGCSFIDSLNVAEITPLIGQGEAPFAGTVLNCVVNYSINPGIFTKELC